MVTIAGHRLAVRGMEQGPVWKLACGWLAAVCGFAGTLYAVLWWTVVA